MLDKMISQQVFQQPKLGKLAFEQAKQEVAKREKTGEDLKKQEAYAAATRGFMPQKHVQASQVYVKGMQDAYISYRKSGSQADLQRYTDLKNNLMSTLAVGKARYDRAASARNAAYEAGFEGVLGGQAEVDGQWTAVMETGFDEEPTLDPKTGLLVVKDNGETLAWQNTIYSDVKNINAGKSDYILEKATEVPKLAIPSEASSGYRNLLNVEEDDSWSDVATRIDGQLQIDRDSKEYRDAAAIYYYRDVLGRAKDNRQLSPAEKREAIEKYSEDEKGHSAAWSSYTRDIKNRLEKEYGRDPDDDGTGFSLGANEKRILDRPLDIHKKMQLVRPDGQTMDIDLYSMDMKALDISYDKAEGQKVDKIYFDQNGNLDHFIIKVPAEKIKNGSFDDLLSADITIEDEGAPKDMSMQERLEYWKNLPDLKAAQKKFVKIRVFDPRELNRTFGETMGGLLSQKVQMETGQQVVSRLQQDGVGDQVANEILAGEE